MDIYALSDKRIAQEWGGYIKALRLQKNRTQKNLAETTCLSLNVIKALELGAGKLSSLIAVLRELEALESLNKMIAHQPMISPLQRARMQGKERQRASRWHRKRSSSEGKSEW